MIDRALGSLFKVVTDEAARNPAFAGRMEEALGKFAQDYAAKRLAERQVGDFHPHIEFKKGTPEEFRARLMKFDAQGLRIVIEKHNLDPASALSARAAKKALVDHVFEAASKRAERDARLFEY